MNPDDVDLELMVEMFAKYGNYYLTAERIREELKGTTFQTELGKLNVTASLGVATFFGDIFAPGPTATCASCARGFPSSRSDLLRMRPAGMWLASAAISIRSTNPGFSLGWNVDCTHHARSTLATMTCSPASTGRVRTTALGETRAKTTARSGTW